jgi:hypothetical protein
VSAASGALEAVDRILNRGGEPDAVLGAVVAVLHERGFRWVGIAYGRPDALRRGPEAGERPAEPSLRTPVVWQGKPVGELQADPRRADAGDRALLERVALLVSQQVATAA